MSRCSLAIRPIDVWTGKVPGNSAIQVMAPGTGRKPIRTSDGSYAFLDLSGSQCTLVITSSTYLEVTRTVTLAGVGDPPPVLTVGLLPNAVYAPPAAATGLVFKVCDEAGRPLAGAAVSAYADDENAARGRLAEEKAAGDGATIRYSAASGKLLAGDSFVLRDRDGKSTGWAMVEETSESGTLRLTEPLDRKWSRGTRLLPAVQTLTDANGLAVVPFRGHIPAACPVSVSIAHGDLGYSAVWNLEGGKVVNRAPVTLQRI